MQKQVLKSGSSFACFYLHYMEECIPDLPASINSYLNQIGEAVHFSLRLCFLKMEMQVKLPVEFSRILDLRDCRVELLPLFI